MFYRWRTIKGRRYLYAEERWREGKKVKSRSRIVRLALQASFDVGGDLGVAAALPFMIAHDLVSGNRVKAMSEVGPASHVELSAMARAAQAQALYDRFGMYRDPKWNGLPIEKGHARQNISYAVRDPVNQPGRWAELQGRYGHMKAEAAKSLHTPEDRAARSAAQDKAYAVEDASRISGGGDKQAESAPDKDAPDAEGECDA